MKRQITPLEFAGLMRTAVAYRAQGFSTIESAKRACNQHYISDDWALPMIATLNDSQAIAMAWGDRLLNEALDRAHARAEASHD